MKLAKDISIAAFAAAISVATIAKPTQAALVNYGFTVNATLAIILVNISALFNIMTRP